MTTKIKENIFTGYPSHLRIMIIMIMVMMEIIMITSGGDGHKIIKNDHLTLSTTILLSSSTKQKLFELKLVYGKCY